MMESWEASNDQWNEGEVRYLIRAAGSGAKPRPLNLKGVTLRYLRDGKGIRDQT